MAGPIDILRELHRLRRHARDLQEAITRGPGQIKAQQARVARQEELLRENQDALKRLKVTAHEKEVSLRTTHQQIDRYETQRNQVGSKKEYDALGTELTAARGRVQHLENEILETMVETEERMARTPELEKALERTRSEFAEFERGTRERMASQTQQLAQVQQQIKEVEATLPEDVLPLYARQVAARGEDAMAAVQDRTCTACYTSFTAQSYNDLLAGRLVTCKSCGRILYLPE